MKKDKITTTEPEETEEEIEREMETGEKEETVYNKEGDELLEEEEEIDELEEGFMEGYNEDIKSNECAFCHKLLNANDNPIEEEINGELYYFCSEDHASKFKKKK